MDDDNDNLIPNGNCEYLNLHDINFSCENSLLHLNIRSLTNKVAELETLLDKLDWPKIVVLSECWLNTSYC